MSTGDFNRCGAVDRGHWLDECPAISWASPARGAGMWRTAVAATAAGRVLKWSRQGSLLRQSGMPTAKCTRTLIHAPAVPGARDHEAISQGRSRPVERLFPVVRPGVEARS